ncbi:MULTISPECIES: hypothetical protein [Ferrimicrobium]|uniref:Uncharacterized protein n=1 Tax=Ferrimicrobium acidiphilum TaxID=121039 RepID=A0ABV3Y6W4_9ACTN|nr:hypothetical protein [Ferrimicrobium sp.]
MARATYDETAENKTTQEVTVPLKATRRVLSPSYKARILKEYDSWCAVNANHKSTF